MRGERGASAGPHRRRTFLLVLAVAAGGVPVAGCSVLLDWSGYRVERTDAGADATVDHEAGLDGDGAAESGPPIDAPTLLSCGVDKLCSPAVPQVGGGWAGPYALFTGAQANLPSCDTSGYLSAPAFEGKGGLDAGPAQCGCSCAAPQGVRCTSSVTSFSDSYCDASTACGPPASLDTCVQLACPNLSIDAPKVAGGACTPAPTVTLPPAWSSAARACLPATNAAQGSCNPNEVCLPSAAPFCIKNAGDVPCPAGGDYPFRYLYYGGSSDSRGCSPCSCGAPSGGACAFPPPPSGQPPVPPVGSFDSTCQIPTGMPFIVPLSCAGKVPSAFAVQFFPDAGPRVTSPGSCPADGGMPTGTVVPSSPTTFCCTR